MRLPKIFSLYKFHAKTSMSKSLSPTLVRIGIGILLTVMSFLLLYAAQSSRSFANWYSRHIYSFLVNTIGRFFGLFPFSFVELALYILIILLLFSFLWMIIRTIRHQKCSWAHYGSSLLLLASVLFFSYTVCCGINYGRSSFSESTRMETFTYTAEELAGVCEYLTGQVNQLAPQMGRTDSGTAVMGDDVPGQARAAMRKLGTSYKELEGYYPTPKGLTVPYILSIQNLSGIYAPFTIEANYNSAMVEFNLPFTACHELSHLRGFMQEEEANFIAFLACTGADNAEFQYSGYLLGWIYATNQLYHADYDSYQRIYSQLTEEVRNDLAENNAFWKKYDGRIAEVSNQINDGYLKANGQSDGVESYDRMVDLMMVYYQNVL